MRNKVVILMLGVLLYCGGLAQAVPITIQITGNVTSAGGSSLPTTIYAGVGFTGTYTYNSATPNTSTLSYVGQYVHNSPYGVEILMGGLEFMTVSNHIGQFEVGIVNVNMANYDWYKIISNENTSVNGVAVEYISWALGGPPSTISSLTLPVSAPKITDWTTNVLEISGQNLFIQGIVTHAELIPEPLTGALMAMGVLFFRRRR